MTIKQFIEKAIKGGWIYRGGLDFQEWHVYDKGNTFIRAYFDESRDSVHDIAWEEIFLDPKAWQACGKVEGWKTTEVSHGNWDEMRTMTTESVPTWKHNMHSMIDVLAEGKTIEQYISTL